uniref:Ribonuclease H-like domain-containing protein n=1 Tax=Tanacetum cinerariifolium TaxID=118510 RepID=A0A6L2MBV3_TANCI|nr:ribonuclease H-like domain-containing protein [Tanacetum cinerariifolium]
MTTLADKAILSGADNRSPMLEKELYDSSKSIIELYMMNRQHERMILEFVENGPLIWPIIEKNEVTRPRKYNELTPAEALQAECDVKAANIILQGLPNEIYALVSHHKVAKDLWGKNSTSHGETLRDFYLRFSLLLNDLNIYNVKLEQFQVNTKFLNSLPPEWSKFVTDVKIVRDLHTTNIDQLHAYLEQHEFHANEPSIPPLEYVHIVNQQQQQQLEFSSLDLGLNVLVFKQSDDLIDAINHMISFLTSVVTSCYPSTNNQLRNSSNPRQQATINDGRVTLQPVQERQSLFLRARGTLLMALPDKHQLKFNIHKDAKSLMEAIEKRFGRNKETKKVQKTLLKQQYEKFSGLSFESLDQIHDRLHKLISQLEILADLEDQSLDDLFNNLKIYVAKCCPSVTAVSTKVPASILPNVDNLSDVVIYSFFASQSNSPQLDNDDLKQIDADDLEEMDLNYDWSFQADEEPTNYALMAFTSSSSSSSDNENENVFEEDIKLLKLDVMLRDNALVALRKKFEAAEKERDELKHTLEKFQTFLKNLMFDCDELNSSDSDVSVPPSPVHDSETVPNVFNVKPGTTKPNKYMSQSHRPSAPIIEDWVSDSENESEGEPMPTQKEPSFVQPTKHVKTPRTYVNHLKQAKNLRKDIPNSRGPKHRWNRKACFVCKSVNHLIKDCDYYEKKMVQKPILNHAMRANHQNYAMMTHSHSNKHVVPTAVLTRSRLVPLNAARPVTTAVSQTHVKHQRLVKLVVTKPHSPIRRPIHHRPTPKNNNFHQKVTTVKATQVNAVQGTKGNWIQVSHGLGPQKTLSLLFDVHGNPQQALKDKGVIDSGCSRHMTGNISYLSDFEQINGGYVAFGGNPKCGKITGKCKIRTGKLDFDDVYFVKELKFNLFSVSQMCDKKNSVLFSDTECVVLSFDFKLPDENHVLLRVPKENNMYNVDLKSVVPSGDLTCLFAKATLDESNIWHRRLGHINFKTMKKLVKGNLVRGLPSKVFENHHTCVACKKGKQHRASYKTKSVTSVSQPLQRVLVTKPHNKTPYELLLGRTPSIGFIRPFRCPVTILSTLNRLGKFNGKADEGFLVGYSVSSKAFRAFNSKTRIVQETLHINFLKNQPNVVGSGPKCLFDIDTLTQSMNYQPVVTGNQPNYNAGIQGNFDAGKVVKEAESAQQYVLLPLWSTGSKDPQNTDADDAFDEKDNESAVHVSTSSSDKPKKHDEKAKREAKGNSPIDLSTEVKDLSDEFKEFSVNSTNRVNAASAPVIAVGPNLTNSTSSFNVAGPSDNAVSPTFKIDDEEDVGAEANFSNLETSITVSPIPTTRVHKDHPVTQIIGDLSSAPQTRSMTRMEEGIDYEEVFAPLARIEDIWLFLAYASFMGFMVYQTDVKSVFLYGTIEKEVCACQPLRFEDPDYPDKVYMDDIIFGSTNKELCKAFEKLMKDKFQMSSMGELTFFLGLQVKQKDNGIFISQDKYVAEILRKFGLTDGKSASTPINTEKPLLKAPDGEDVDVHIYKSMISSLMYLTSSRPNIMFVVCAYARFQVTPKVSHLHAVKRIFRLVATSSTEVEYVAAASSCAQVLWIQNQLLDYGNEALAIPGQTTTGKE